MHAPLQLSRLKRILSKYAILHFILIFLLAHDLGTNLQERMVEELLRNGREQIKERKINNRKPRIRFSIWEQNMGKMLQSKGSQAN